MNNLFLENISSILLGIHLVIAIITLVVLLVAVAYLVFASEKEQKTGIKAAFWGAWGYIASFIFGLLIYPVFRVNVRAADFDKFRPWATGLFEIKEHIGAIALFTAIGTILLVNSVKENSDKRTKNIFNFLVATVALIFLIKFIFGFILSGLNKI